MLQTTLLKAGLAAMACLEAVEAARTSPTDIAKFPDFEQEMQANGGHTWSSVPVTTATGYNLTLFRITGNSLGADYVDTKGPVLLLEGMFSNCLDWIRTNDPTETSMGVQLAERGHDVWIASTRGRMGASTHSTLIDLTDPLQETQYWDYSFENIGKEDIPAYVDAIIAARAGACNKVTLVPHSTGVNAALVAATQVEGLNTKVGAVSGLAPCFKIGLSQFFMPDFADP